MDTEHLPMPGLMPKFLHYALPRRIFTMETLGMCPVHHYNGILVQARGLASHYLSVQRISGKLVELGGCTLWEYKHLGHNFSLLPSVQTTA